MDINNFWSEKVLVITNDYEITGYVFLPKTNKRNRMLSDILNGDKRFVAIKDAKLKPRHGESFKVEVEDFIQINLQSINLIKPCKDEE